MGRQKFIADSSRKRKLVVMIQRGEELIIPNGNTVFAPGDTIVIKER